MIIRTSSKLHNTEDFLKFDLFCFSFSIAGYCVSATLDRFNLYLTLQNGCTGLYM